eukprot:Gb_08249 [translate_table: standard]
MAIFRFSNALFSSSFYLKEPFFNNSVKGVAMRA